MRLLQSLEELLYELVSWLVFYPVTLWRTLRRPQQMMRYADVELGDAQEERYKDTLSPPLFLLLTLLFAHGLELALIAHRDDAMLPEMLRNDTNLLIFRAFLFSIFPLLMAVRLLGRTGAALDRETLKPPFYSQCYVAAPFAFGLSAGMNIARTGHQEMVAVGTAISLLSLLWYVIVEVRWFEHDLHVGRLAAVWLVLRTVAEATVLLLAATMIVAQALGVHG
ncbi:permease [Shinella sp. CPCC 100929]|uniref:Permease n=2 Tax=Shinella lacus TaxID=2654216 RepID=A0ABT1R7Y9_9HYPH|nr:permease [Shinella lacus]